MMPRWPPPMQIDIDDLPTRIHLAQGLPSLWGRETPKVPGMSRGVEALLLLQQKGYISRPRPSEVSVLSTARRPGVIACAVAVVGGPEQVSELVGNIPAKLVRHVLVALRHTQLRPTHQIYDHP